MSKEKTKRRRYTVTAVKHVFKEAGCQLLEEVYHNNKTPMRYRCHCGREAHIALQDFIRGVRCGCGRKAEGVKRRHSIDDVRRYFADHGCELLAESYQGNHALLQFRCECGETGHISFSDFQNGVRCGCRRHLGLHRKWTEDRVVEELTALIAEQGTFPSANELRHLNRRGLGSAIQSLGGFNYFRHRLGHELSRKPHRYWNDWENVERELRLAFGEMIGRGLCPSSRMILEAGISTSIITTFDGLPRIAARLNCSLSSCWKVRDGHTVFSFYEFILDEYLYSIGLPHEPNVRFTAKNKYTCDQKVGDYYIEIFGFSKSDNSSRSRAYQRKRKTKEAAYKRLGLDLVPIEKEVFVKPYSEIEKYLDSLFVSLGFDVSREDAFDICELAQCAGFILTEDEVLRQLKQIIQNIGEFPTINALVDMGRYDLVTHIQKTGGQNYYRKQLGLEPPVKPNNHWTLEQTLKMLNKRSDELGRLPRQSEMASSLAHAVQKHGGIYQLARSLGLAAYKRPNGWWDEPRVLQALETEIIPILGHYPNAKELQKMGRYDVFNAIARNGGFRFFRQLYLDKSEKT